MNYEYNIFNLMLTTTFVSLSSIGILLQGSVTEWTKDIILEYKNNFPEAEIVLSTWPTDDLDKIPCKKVVSYPPQFTKPFKSNINHQIIGTLAGLKELDTEIILKCRTDQFIHNKKIFELYEKKCDKSKIMTSNYGTWEKIDYFASDLCQLATKKILLEYWNSIPYYDGSLPVVVEIYLTANYILRVKKDFNAWFPCLRKYFYVKSYIDDWKIEWEKIAKNEVYRNGFEKWYARNSKPQA